MKGIKNGFSLIEMVIAIVIIGVLSLPLLAYFSGAAINSSRGSMVQTGEMAAQSIIEEINSYDTYGQLANAAEGAVSGCAFTVDASEPEDGNDYLLRDITVDDVDMTAKIRIDYDYESPDDLNYNTYRVPDLRALYTEQNAVAVEEDQTDLSVNEFYYKHEGTISKANIKRNMTRTGEINIVTNAEDEDLFDISAGYEYQHLSDEPVTFTVLKTQILKEDFRCFYFLYDILSEDAGVNEEFNINFSSDITTDEAKEMSIYFICQKPEGYRIPPGYRRRTRCPPARPDAYAVCLHRT